MDFDFIYNFSWFRCASFYKMHNRIDFQICFKLGLNDQIYSRITFLTPHRRDIAKHFERRRRFCVGLI